MKLWADLSESTWASSTAAAAITWPTALGLVRQQYFKFAVGFTLFAGAQENGEYWFIASQIRLIGTEPANNTDR